MEFNDLLKQDRQVYCSSLFNTNYFYQLLTLKQLQTLENMAAAFSLSDMDRNEIVFKQCIIHPKGYKDEDKAGIVYSLGQYIYNESANFSQLNEQLPILHNVYSIRNPLDWMKITICVAFPIYKIEDFDTYDKHMLLKRFIQAEQLLKLKNPQYEFSKFEQVEQEE